MKPVFSHLRKLRHSIFAYIDDCLLPKETCIRNVDQTEYSRQSRINNLSFKFGFLTIKTISVWVFILDSEKMIVSCTHEKANDVI